MKRIILDLSGKRFGSFVVIRKTKQKDKKGRYLWECLYDDGKISFKRADNIYGQYEGRYKRTRLYNIWNDMKQRVLNPKNSTYRYYGGRGITICSEWLEFHNFHNWALSNGYSDKLSIDRIDNNGNYCPENCRWVTQKEQSTNRRGLHKITHNGKSLCCRDWDRLLGYRVGTVGARLNIGWTDEEALIIPLGVKREKYITLERREKCLQNTLMKIQ